MAERRDSATVASIQRVAWGLLAEWWCVPVTESEERIAEAVHEAFGLGVAVALVKDRLFGGFACHESRRNRHVYFATSCYTYTHPEANTPLTDERRRAEWKLLIDENGEPGSGPFTGW
jgi:hypothetical protein